MIKYNCPNCGKDHIYNSLSDIPVECSYCFEPIEKSTIIEEPAKKTFNIESLTIFYQMTQEQIVISTEQKVILGRDNFGKEVFSAILNNGKPIISRVHCSIEFKDGKFWLADEGSLNGTFYGINKIDCRKKPQVIEDNGIFYIGQEPFLARINLKNEELQISEKTINNLADRPVKHYRCNDQNCSGYISDEFFQICPVCGAFKNFSTVYE